MSFICEPPALRATAGFGALSACEAAVSFGGVSVGGRAGAPGGAFAVVGVWGAFWAGGRKRGVKRGDGRCAELPVVWAWLRLTESPSDSINNNATLCRRDNARQASNTRIMF